MPRVSEEELKRRAEIFEAAMKRRDPPWTITALATASGLHHSHVSRMVAGKDSGSTAAVAALAAPLGIDLNVLLSPQRSSPSPETSEDSEPVRPSLDEEATPAPVS